MRLTRFIIPILLLIACGHLYASERNSTEWQTLDPYKRVKWLSEYKETWRDRTGWFFVLGGVGAVAGGIALHSIGATKPKGWPYHAGAAALDVAGLGLLGTGIYYLSSHESFTYEIEIIERNNSADSSERFLASELLLKTNAEWEKSKRYALGYGGIVIGGLGLFAPLFKKLSTSGKITGVSVGAGMITYGFIRLLFPTQEEIFWTTYQEDKAKYGTPIHSRVKDSGMKVQPSMGYDPFNKNTWQMGVEVEF